MKFVFFGYDFSLPTLKRLIKDGHEAVAIFTFPCDNTFNFNTGIKKIARDKNIPITEDTITNQHIKTLIEQGAELFLSCGYTHKIPPIDEKQAYAVNVHPTYLPKLRGLMPTPDIILNHPESGGFTAHKMTQDFDAGDILLQVQIEVNDTTTVDSYTDTLIKRYPAALSNLIKDLPGAWEKACPQDESQATTAILPDNAMRTIHWHHNIRDIDRRLRAFGSYGCLSVINNQRYAIFKHTFKTQDHPFPPGTVTEVTDTSLTIAAGKDTGKQGLITLEKFQKL